MNNLSIDQTIEFVKNIVDNVRCAICDKIDGDRMRYSCGHTACSNCVLDTGDCLICLTPPQTSSSQPRSDDAFTERVKNASVLLQTCEVLFNTDVFERKRLSEQLRIEKELFPKCIQAPVKYENKRKSKIFSYKNKENRRSSYLPGEKTSPLKENIMENTVGYVQQWLSKNDKDFTRKPFRDLNVNTQLDNINTISSKNNDNVPVLQTNRKRSHFKTTDKKKSPVNGNKKSTKKKEGNFKKIKRDFQPPCKDDVTNKSNQMKCEIDESGIFMDNDPIIIDDSQETLIDKDRNAWLAVIEANKYERNESTSAVNLDHNDAKTLNNINNKVGHTSTKSDELKSKEIQFTKVPFYKKYYITETCTSCNITNKTAGQSEQLKIVIDNDNFTTTIKILNNDKYGDDISKLKTTNSVSVQTDTNQPKQINKDITTKDSVIEFNEKLNVKYNGDDDKSDNVGIADTKSEDLFADEVKDVVHEYVSNAQHCLVIEESDSDMDMDRSGPLPVKVDVHRSCDDSEYGILGEIVNIEERDGMPRRGPRGITPTSTDSSEKENFNPNRVKTHIFKKKKYAKKLK